MDGKQRFDEIELPSKDSFYSNLIEEGITDDEYARAQQVFHQTGCRNLRDYHDLYLKLVVLLLADVFEKFRCLTKSVYQLDPLHF